MKGLKKGTCKITCTAADGSKVKAQISLNVKKYDVVIDSPKGKKVNFDTVSSSYGSRIQIGRYVIQDMVETIVTFKNNRVKGESDNYLIPLKAGEDRVTVTVKENGRQTSKKTYTVYVSQSVFSNNNIKSSSNYKYKLLKDGTAEITEYIGKDTKLNIPSELDKHRVTSIGEGAFSACLSLTDVTIPGTIISINAGAFFNCRSIKKVTIGNGVTSIGSCAFSLCENLTTVILPDSLTIIEGQAFDTCPSLTSITIPDSVVSIGNFAFNSCTNMKNVTIGKSVNSIGYYAFSNCTSLASVIIPNNVTSIDYCAFCKCTNLTSIIIPDSVTDIGSDAFQYCDKLTTVNVGRGSYAEDYCIKNQINYTYLEDHQT